MDKVHVELSKKELYSVAKMLKVSYVSKATKEMLVKSINEQVDLLNSMDASLQENPLGSNGLESETVVPSEETPLAVEETLHVVEREEHLHDLRPDMFEEGEVVKLKEHHRGYHPITGELV
jgi:hypothetical protein